jgi:hypothetical protein
MQNTLPFEQLHQLFGAEFTAIGKSLEELSSLYIKLPVPESIKKRFTEATLKNKSAWYACLVNNNIDVLLVPEYLESRQSRNILIKKETDQYFKSIERFEVLSGKSNASLYESIVVTGEVPHSPGIDLFSNQASPTAETCPAEMQNLFESWNLSLAKYGHLESMVYSFLEWHQTNQYSFANNRQTVLWFNYQFWKRFGHVSFDFNMEHYLFHQWHKNSHAQALIKGLLGFIGSETERIREALKLMYKDHIDFNLLKSQQKLISGFLFSNCFHVALPAHLQQQHPVMKTLIKKGYVELKDFGQKPDHEKLKNLFMELSELSVIYMANDDGERYICLNPSYKENKGRLDGYNNVKMTPRPFEWDEFISQSIAKVILPKASRAMPEPEVEPVRKRQKAFFG